MKFGAKSHAPIRLAGAHDYLTILGQVITLDQINLTTDVTGTLPIANGGTGATSFTTGSVLFAGASAILQDNSNLFWDDGSNRLGIGTATPDSTLEVEAAGTVSFHLDGNQAAINIDRSTVTRFAQLSFSTSGTADWVMGLSDTDIFGVGTEFYIGNSASDQKFIILNGGNIGINVIDPDAMLEIGTSGTGEEGLKIKGTASQTGALFLMTDSSDATFFTSGDGLTSSVVQWNAQGVDIDFQVFGNAVDELLFVNAGTDRIGIGTNAPVATLDINGGFAANIVAKTAAYTATVSDHVITCDATSAAFTVTLPAATGVTGIIYHIKKTDVSANAVTVDGASSEVIDDSTTISLASQYDSVTIICNGTAWFIL